jgi:hypothetical protein
VKRSLLLRRHRLGELSTAELSAVAGAAPPSKDCLDRTYHCPTQAPECDLGLGTLLCP